VTLPILPSCSCTSGWRYSPRQSAFPPRADIDKVAPALGAQLRGDTMSVLYELEERVHAQLAMVKAQIATVDQTTHPTARQEGLNTLGGSIATCKTAIKVRHARACFHSGVAHPVGTNSCPWGTGRSGSAKPARTGCQP
jgi:hypothetical protein